MSDTTSPLAGLGRWIVGGVGVFAILATVTILVLVRNPPTAPQSIPVTPATASATPSVNPAERDPGESPLTRVALTDFVCSRDTIRRDHVPADELHGYLDSLIDCLMEVHTAPFRAVGLTLRRPALSPESEVGKSGCITNREEPDDWAGLYCSANTTIYYRTDWAPANPLQYVEVMTHEFAHHLQQQSDILNRVTKQQDSLKESGQIAQKQELSRRLELQAECLTGVMVGPNGPLAVRKSEFMTLLESRSSIGSEWAATHGTGRAQTRWFRAGADAPSPAKLSVCSTFKAASSLVS